MTAFNSVPVRAAVDDVALVAGEEVEVDVAEGAVGAPVGLLDVVPVRVGPEVLPAAVVAGALDVGDGVGRVLMRVAIPSRDQDLGIVLETIHQ